MVDVSTGQNNITVTVTPTSTTSEVTISSSGTSASAGVNWGAEIYAERAKEYATQAGTSATLAGVAEDNSEVWAEGTDAEVTELGGTHSSKGWAELSTNANTSLSNLNTTGEAHFQAPLVSGTNIKTINNTSLLGSGNITIQSAPSTDDETISLNSSDELQAIGVIDNNTSNALKYWTGTKAQYEAITTKDSNTLYNITDDTDITLTLLQTIYPVGSIYITTNSTCPLASLFGTWTLVGADRVLQGAGTRGTVGTTVDESLPNITGSMYLGLQTFGGSSSGALNLEAPFSGIRGGYYSSATDNNSSNITFNASNSSSTYQDNAPVQPDAYLVNIYRRTA